MKAFLLIALSIGILLAKEATVHIAITGMTCPLCTMTIKKNLKRQTGVTKAKVILNTHTATVTYDDTKVQNKTLLKAIEEVGYKGKVIDK